MALYPLIVIAGQTASGKSSAGIKLARKYNGEIICADSRTIYKDMDIGTAKPSKTERAEIRHHLLDVMEPDKRFSANDFKIIANKAIKDITSRSRIPFIVGGTGLYINSVVYDFKFDGDKDHKLRENTLFIGFKLEPDELKVHIRRRVDNMIVSGLEGEVRNLANVYGFDAPGMNAICYKEWKGFFNGEQSLEALKQKLYTNNWQYARRQNTWFKRYKNINWVTSVDEASRLVQQFLIQ